LICKPKLALLNQNQTNGTVFYGIREHIHRNWYQTNKGTPIEKKWKELYYKVDKECKNIKGIKNANP